MNNGDREDELLYQFLLQKIEEQSVLTVPTKDQIRQALFKELIPSKDLKSGLQSSVFAFDNHNIQTVKEDKEKTKYCVPVLLNVSLMKYAKNTNGDNMILDQRFNLFLEDESNMYSESSERYCSSFVYLLMNLHKLLETVKLLDRFPGRYNSLL
jgi:hypothetical protein